MDVTIKDGFYVDPETNRVIYIKKGMVPPWVKTKPSDLKLLPRKGGEKK